jgi:23S rRNA pseudouridine955/2504/2580 synthase
MSKKLSKLKSITELLLDENDDFMIINKPPFLSTLEDRRDPVDVLSLAREYHPDSKVCHRLDKETSGALVVAKNDNFYKYMAGCFEHRDVTKLYHTIVEGRQEIDELVIEKPIYSSNSRSRIDFMDGKPSLTMVKTIEIYKMHTLLACMPFTGRMHQIRVHLADAGMPICGDEFYGGNPIFLSQFKKNFTIGKNKEETPMMPRLSLHAAGLSFPLPSGEKYTIKAPYPKDFMATLRQLEKNKL